MRAFAPFLLLISSLAALAAEPVRPAEPLPPLPATSAVLIVAVPADATPTEQDAIVQRRVNTHVATIRSEHHLRRLLTNPESEIRKTQWFQTAANPRERAAWLADHLKARGVPGTPLIEVSLDDLKDPADRRVVLHEVCAAYLKYAKDVAVNELMDRTTALNNVRIKAEMRLKDLTADQRDKQIRINTGGGAVGVGGTDRVGVKETELAAMVNESVAAQLEAAHAKAAFEAYTAAAEKNQPLPGVAERVRCDPRLTALVLRLDDVEVRVAVLNAKRAIPANEAGAAENEAKFLRARIDALTKELTDRERAEALAEVRARFTAAQRRLESLVHKVEFLKADLGELNNALIQFTAMNEECNHLREQIRKVKAQIEATMATAASTAASGINWHLMPEEGNR